MIDMEAGARVAGSRFAYLKGDLVLLELALFRWARRAARRRTASCRSCRRCWCARRRCTAPASCPTPSSRSTGCADDDLYLVGTSEVPLASLHAGEILDGGRLPLRYAGISPCFRREAGAAGRDTRGILRVHQFDKVEMFSFVEPEAVGRRARAAAGDRGGAAARARRSRTASSTSAPTTSAPRPRRSTTSRRGCPGQDQYREVTSTSNTTDFQSRRLDIRYRATTASRATCTRSTAPRSRGGT